MSTKKTIFTPNFGRVLVRPIEDKVGSVIHIPDVAKEKPQEGEVIAISGRYHEQTGRWIDAGYAVGAKIVFGKYSGSEIVIDGEKFLIMREEDIYGGLS